MIKSYEYTVMWEVEGGFQYAHVYVNSENKPQAKKLIRDKLKNKKNFVLFLECAISKGKRSHIPENSILVWYFDKNSKEIEEII